MPLVFSRGQTPSAMGSGPSKVKLSPLPMAPSTSRAAKVPAAWRRRSTVEGLALAEELGREEEVELFHALARIAEVEAAGVAHGDGRFDDHHGVGVDGQHEVDDFLDVGGVEVVLHRVVVGRGGDHDEVGVGIGRFAIEGGDEGAMAWLLSLIGAHAGKKAAVAEVFLDVVVLDGRDTAVEFLDFLGDDIDCCHMVVLGQQGGNAQADVACAGHSDLDIFEITHIFDYFYSICYNCTRTTFRTYRKTT